MFVSRESRFSSLPTPLVQGLDQIAPGLILVMLPLGKPIEQVLGISALLLLAIGCAIMLRPFLSALLWAAILCFSTWPIYRWCEAGPRRTQGVGSRPDDIAGCPRPGRTVRIIVAALAHSVSDLVTAATPSACSRSWARPCEGRPLRLDRHGARPGPPGRHWFLDCRRASGAIARLPYVYPVVRAGGPSAFVGVRWRCGSLSREPFGGASSSRRGRGKERRHPAPAPSDAV